MNKPLSRRSAGFTMIEVLVTLVILLLGLLGLSGMQAKAQQAEFESYQRTQALVLLNDMADRINRNREAASCYEITDTSGAPYAGTSSTVTPACAGVGTAEAQQLALNDLTQWHNLLLGASETSGGANIGAVVAARGCISRDNPDPSTDIYTVAVAWQGMTDTAAPSAPAGASVPIENAVACGANLYGDETKRRVVWTTVRIATLL